METFALNNDPGWIIIEEGYSAARELEVEALLTISNGYAGTRGTLFERGSPLGPGTLVAGVFDIIPGEHPIPALVAAPDWVRLRMEIMSAETCRDETGLACGRLVENRRILDMSQGVLWREFKHEDPSERLTCAQGFRLASQSDRHLFIQSLEITPANYSARVRIEAESELYQTNYRSYLNPYPIRAQVVRRAIEKPEDLAVVLFSYGSGAQIVFAAASRMTFGKRMIAPQISRLGNRVAEHWELELEVGEKVRIDRMVSVFTSRDDVDPAEKAINSVQEAWQKTPVVHISNHIESWKKRWSMSEIQIEGAPETERALRFATYSLISAANPEDEKSSIGARALTGNSYLGHVFWDTEIFMLPFFIFNAPETAKSLLMYRYHTLSGARQNAKRKGFKGAMYPWESADTGDETTPPSMLSPSGEKIRILTGDQEHHITSDVAYAVSQYCTCTGDTEFKYGPGAEIVFETARFWASRVKRGTDNKFHIEGAIGPDEYHENVNNNFFTNEMARWNLRFALSLYQEMQISEAPKLEKLAKKINLDPNDLSEWSLISELLNESRERDRVIEQFTNFFKLEDVRSSQEDQPGGTDFRIFIDQERLSKTQLIKQADVLMAMYLLWDTFPEDKIQKNFEYYEKRTLHGSSLSPAIHALIAARLGKSDLALRYLKMAAEVDLENNMGNASGGVHSAAQGGLWQATILGFGGLSLNNDHISISPKLPKKWSMMRFNIFYCGQLLRILINNSEIRISNAGDSSVKLKVQGAAVIELASKREEAWKLKTS